jgi:opacity protein-like surface antigen
VTHRADEAKPSDRTPGQQLALGAGSHYFLADLEPVELQEAEVVETKPLAIQVAADERPRFDPDLSVQRSRAYLSLRYGRAFFADTEPVDGFSFEESFGVELIGGSIGFNWGRYLGAEISVDGWETDVSQDGLGDIQEYAVSTVLLQGRLRYPMMDDRLAPYIIGGVGGALTQTNDRTPLSDTPQAREFSADEIDPAFGIGGGVEYFIADNIALGLEAKYIFLDADVEVDGKDESVNLDTFLIAASLRMHYPGLDFQPDGEQRADGDWDHFSLGAMRPYFALRIGGAFIPSEDLPSGFSLPIEEREQAQGLSLGVDFNRYLGAELSVDFFESNIDASGNIGKVAELNITNFTPLMRARYPVLEGRLVPYGLAGIGMSFIEVNDRTAAGENPKVERISAQDIGFSGTLGAGLEYFITDNITFGIETKYVHHENQMEVDGNSEDVTIDTILVQGGLRIYFP